MSYTLEDFDTWLPGETGPSWGTGAAVEVPLGRMPVQVPAHIARRLHEPVVVGLRSEALFSLVAACVEWGFADSATIALVERHPPSVSKYGRLAGAEALRAARKLRPDHPHEGLPCDRARCPHAPRWMR